jgi:thioredoxin-related protein
MKLNIHFYSYKSLFLVLLTLGLYTSGKAQKPAFPKIETYFPKLVNWEASLKKAKEANKLLFVDCYTDWCYWCIVMDKKNFRDTSVSNKMQSFMDCYSLEMEQDSLGRLLRYHYGVASFPTFLVFNGDGNLLFTYRGYTEKEYWMKEMDSAYNIIQTQGSKGKYARPGFPKMSPNNIPDWFMPFINSKDFTMYKDTSTSGFSEQYNNMTDVFELFSVGRLSQYYFTKEHTQQWMSNIKLFDSLYGNDLTRFHTEQLWSTQVYKAINTNNETEFKENLEELLKWTEYPDYAKYSNWMHWYKTQKNWNAMANLFDDNCKTTKYPVTAREYNQTAWTLCKETDDVALLKKALKYSEKSIELSPEYKHFDTKANLEFKLKDYKSAEASAEKSIELGIAAKEDVKKTQELLAEIRAAGTKARK